MTLIIGVRCQEGIAIGADSMVKVGSDFGNIQMTSEKTRLLDENDGIAAFAGDVGLGQIILDSLASSNLSPSSSASKNDTKDAVTQAIGNTSMSYYNMSRYLGEQLEVPELLVALPVKEQPSLVLYRRAIPIAEATEGMCFLTAGSGADLANSFLKFLERVFWQGNSPTTIGEGIFSILWTLNHVIEANAAMSVGGSPSIAVLEAAEHGWSSRMLQREELEIHEVNIETIEEWISVSWASLYSNPNSSNP